MVDSVKALERSLGSMQALFQKHKNYLDSMEKTYWETIRGCLVTCKADLKILQDKLPPPPKESNPHFWENAKAAVANFFQRGCAALSVGDIQVIQNNVQKSIEVVRLHVELLTW
jgi:hypothetical protein